MAIRFDVGALRPPKRLPNGCLRVDAYLTRTGVFTYRNPDGTERREYRPPTEVFKADSLGTFAMVPVTDDHPPEMVTASNAKQYLRGTTGEAVRQDGDRVACTMMITDAELVSKIEAGKVEVSCGYETDLREEPGVTPDGQRYDAVQTNIRGNHVAVVTTGRAGPEVRIRLDHASMVMHTLDHPPTERSTMDEILKQLKEATERAAAEKSRADAAEKQCEELRASAASEKARADGLVKDLESERKQRTDAAAEVPALVKARVELVTQAAPILKADVTAMSDRDIKVAVVKKVDGEDIAADAHVEYVNGMFKGALKRAAASEQALGSLRAATEQTRSDAAGGNEIEDAEAKAQAAARDASLNAWKGKE